MARVESLLSLLLFSQRVSWSRRLDRRSWHVASGWGPTQRVGDWDLKLSVGANGVGPVLVRRPSQPDLLRNHFSSLRILSKLKVNLPVAARAMVLERLNPVDWELVE